MLKIYGYKSSFGANNNNLECTLGKIIFIWDSCSATPSCGDFVVCQRRAQRGSQDGSTLSRAPEHQNVIKILDFTFNRVFQKCTRSMEVRLVIGIRLRDVDCGCIR